MPQLPKIRHTRQLARTRVFQIEQVSLTFSNGVQADYERIMGPPGGGVIVVPMMSDNKLLMIREYGVGAERYELRFPTGGIEPDESVHDGAQRELREETGYAARQLQTEVSLKSKST
ncbi:MAG: NUDIX domain-containing protein [gamma proteobacterium symbiont of Bathyaustriella thionipta]|nr:NUDIX domain-containing protein [gamma proteobacterium symbiont of Bathyaustriella thionipta]